MCQMEPLNPNPTDEKETGKSYTSQIYYECHILNMVLSKLGTGCFPTEPRPLQNGP